MTRSDSLLQQAEFMRGLARRLVSDPWVADDVVQDTWLAALRHAPASERPLRPWLASVLRNALHQRRRTDRRHAAKLESLGTQVGAPEAGGVEVGLSQEETLGALREALRQLPAETRELLSLRFGEGLPPRHIARRLGIPVETVRTRTRRAIARLRRDLDQRCEGGRRAWMAGLGLVARRGSWALGPILGAVAACTLVGFGLWTWIVAARTGPSASASGPERASRSVVAASPTTEPRRDPLPPAVVEAPAVPVVLSGRVRGGDGPLEGVVVSCLPELDLALDLGGVGSFPPVFELERPPIHAQVRTDEQGRFEMPAPELGAHWIVVRAPGHEPWVQEVVWTGHGLRGPELDLELAPSAVVELEARDGGRGWSGSWMLIDAGTPPGLWTRIETDAAGQARLDQLTRAPAGVEPAATLIGRVDADTVVMLPLREGATARAELGRRREIRVRVDDPREVLERTTVTLSVASLPGEQMWVGRGCFDARGVATLEIGEGMLAAVMLEQPDGTRSSSLLGLEEQGGLEVQGGLPSVSTEGPVEIVLRCSPRSSLIGRVTDAEGRPVADRRCALRGPTGERSQARTDACGRYRLSAPAGGYELFVEPGRGTRAHREGVELTEGSNHRDVQLAASTRLQGRVLERDASPASGVRVQLAAPGDPELGPGPRAITDAEGRYVLEGVPGAAELRVVARVRGEAPVESDPIRMRCGLRCVEVPDLMLGGGVALRITVLDPGGRAVPHAGLELRSGACTDPPRVRCDRSDAAGELRLLRGESEELEILATHPDWAPGTVSAPPGSPEVQVRLRRPAEVRGRILCEHGEPFVGIPVCLRGVGDESLSELQTTFCDENGEFCFPRVPDGLCFEIATPLHEARGQAPCNLGDLSPRPPSPEHDTPECCHQDAEQSPPSRGS